MRFWQQVIRKVPFNLRPILNIKPLIHTKTLSDFISAYSYLSLLECSDENTQELKNLIHQLDKLGIKGKVGQGWGLRFPISTRFISANHLACNSFNTINVINSFLDAYMALKESDYLVMAMNGFLYLENEMGYKDFGNFVTWNYWAGLDSDVYNVNGLMLGICARLFKITKEEKFRQLTSKLFRAIANSQNPNGSWYYSNTSNGHWVDGFHTGYILEGLVRGIDAGLIDEADECMQKGLDFYLSTMFAPGGMPKYYPNSIYPIDAQNSAQAIQTVSFINNLGLSRMKSVPEIFFCVDKHLWNAKGYYNLIKTRFWTNKTPMHRWATGPMFLALSIFKFTEEMR